MLQPSRSRVGLQAFAIAVVASLGGMSAAFPSGVSAAGAPPAMTFTPNARADQGETGQGQNEPQVAVDQNGLAYVDWQSSTGVGGSALATTTDGINFAYKSDPDTIRGQVIDGDVDMATTSWPAVGAHTPSTVTGDNGAFFGHLNKGTCGAIQIRNATTNNDGNTFAATDASCSPAQVDRPWIAAYTPPAFRGTSQAVAHTMVFNEYHDFASSEIFVTRSFDGGATYDAVQFPGIQPTSAEHATTFCNSIPSGIAVDQRGSHPGRVYVLWETADQPNNAVQGCDITQAEAFDHVFLSYSDNISDPTNATPTFTSTAVFNDPCAPTPPVPPTSPTSCQDVSELFNSLAVDDAGNVDAAYIYRDISKANPAYDVYVATSSDGGNTFTSFPVSADVGTHYEPWIAAGGNGGIDVVYYRTAFVEQPATLNKPGTAPPTAIWDMYLAQSIDGGHSFTSNKLSDASDATGGVYFGDICTTGIFCTPASAALGYGTDRTLFDTTALAIGPDGGARVAWTDARDTHSGTCLPGPTTTVSCQAGTHVRFACQSSGVGLQGETISGCGSFEPGAAIPEARWIPLLLAGGLLGTVIGVSASARRRRRLGIASI